MKFIRVVTVMRGMNEFLATGPFDLYELQLFHLVAEHQNFTRAGHAAGLTQSAMTRQIRGMEERLGVRLFDRTTRFVRLTPAGAALHARSGSILSELNDAISALKKGFNLEPKTLRVGIAQSVGLAYLPGFFRGFQKDFPCVQLRVSHASSAFIIAAVESGELDAGIVSKPPQLTHGVEIKHRFNDEFVAIAPPRTRLLAGQSPVSPRQLREIFAGKRWLLINEETNTGKTLRGWFDRQGLRMKAAMQVDSFDLIANLVSLGIGVSLVPHRVLALYPNRRPVQRILTEPKFSRELIVIVRRQAKVPEMVAGFVERVLF
ncbi:MAG TPA: LysR family transcriptional regulator [Verrucomicrobiae bacterium]|nr:LysR family transcriptional regulator [Verrucomicrobiae bacterium]